MSRKKRLSVKQETRVAEVLKTTLTPGSGSSNWQSKKADSKNSRILVENKYTEKKSFSLKESELAKVRAQAYIQDLEPVFQVSFLNTNTEVVMITLDFFAYLMELYENDD